MNPNEVENMVVRCRHCNQFEYWGAMRWLNGWQLCRNCYRSEYEAINKKPYEWDDLDGPTPSAEEIAAAIETEKAYAAIGRG